jgi:hypothetical protein
MTCRTLVLLLCFSSFVPLRLFAQNSAPSVQVEAVAPSRDAPRFRVESVSVPNGAELLTLFVSTRGSQNEIGNVEEIPLVSVLRDTLGDDREENDRLRYVWALTYTRPALKQRMAAAIPFFYGKVENKQKPSDQPPPPIIDLGSTDKQVWNRIFWTGLRSLFLNSYGIPLKASTQSYSRDLSDYRKSHTFRALEAISLYREQDAGQELFSHQELTDIQAKLILREKMFGGTVDDGLLQGVLDKQNAAREDFRGQNWELLRQRSEAEGLYFDPLELPDGRATHALVWISRGQILSNSGRKYNSRFLNIKDPWTDSSLRNWNGYTQTRFYDEQHRQVSAEADGARAVELIPLALYGLDEPKIPMLLVDFRNGLNPRKRELSRRVLDDVARNILSISWYGDAPFFLGKSALNFITGRRGIDYNQPSRVHAYSQLKFLLSVDSNLDPKLRELIASKIERVSTNPLQNDFRAEIRIAREQHAALLEYARRPDGLAARLDLDRREELVNRKHGPLDRIIFRSANIASFGLYTHREAPSADLISTLDISRSMNFHERFLREVAASGPQVEVAWDMEKVRRSLQFVADHGASASKRLAKTTAQIFKQTQDDEARRLCLSGLYRFNNAASKSELLQIYSDQNTAEQWRTVTAEYLRIAITDNPRIAPAEARTIMSKTGQ